jgi:disulfide bond formation protein DsbB
MDVTRNRLILLATLGSAALLGGAFAFQYIGGLAPCKLCLTARWPHAAAIGIGALALTLGWRWLPWLGALAAAATAAVGVYHTGIERHWWQGPTSCSSGPIDQLDASALLDQILAAPVVRCDEVAWALGGISMASWNAILSAGLALIWVWAARRA